MRFVAFLWSILLSLLGFATYAQVLITLVPGSATPGQRLDVVVRGMNTHFRNGISQVDFGDGISVQRFYVSNEVTGTATIQLSNTAALGFRDVKVSTGDEEATIAGGFEIFSSSGTLRGSIEVLPVESVSLINIDLTQPAKAPVLFFANIYNDAVPRTIDIRVGLSSSSKGYIGEMLLRNKKMDPNSSIRLTNRDFSAVSMNGPIGEDFLVKVRKLGTFPPDNYEYTLQLIENGNVVATDESSILVTNPVVNPEPISPGASFGQDIMEVYTPFPFFQWFGQNNTYDIALYEARAGQSPQEVIRNVPVFRKTDISATDLLYPGYAEKLINGKVYAWQVQGKATTASGVQYLPAEVFRFRYVDMTGGEMGKSVTRIEIQPQQAEVSTGMQVQFVAICYDKDGMPVSGLTPAWRVNASDKATISASGLLSAGDMPGTIAVIVSAGDITEFALVDIVGNVVYPAGGGWGGNILKQLFGL